MEIFAVIIIFFLAVFIFTAIIEPAYILIFNRPIYVHLYLPKKDLDPGHHSILTGNFRFYRSLSDKRKSYMRHRVSCFINKYEFIGRDGLIVTEEMKVKIAATAVLLSFGMRKYLSNAFSAIILYPDIYQSQKTGDYHKGEFNPAAGAIVFSWKHFEEGLEYDNDNLNLGLHEFSHILHFDSRRSRRPGSSAVIYSDMFDKVMEALNNPRNRQMLIDAGYFREYAYTNQFEFIAVLLEHFFETPQEFRQKFPQLYGMVKKMINYSG